MKSISIFIFVLLFFLPSYGIAEEPKPNLTINFPARVYHIVDGDTLDVETTIRFRVRIRDCWAPETRTKDKEQKKLGLAAKENLRKIALGKKVIVVIPFSPEKLESNTGRIDSVQTLSRWLCEIWINGEKRAADIQYTNGFSGRTKTEQKKLFDESYRQEVDP